MATLQGYDGELRISDHGCGVTHYIEVLFCGMDFSGPVARPQPPETLVLNRGVLDVSSFYVKEPETSRYEPLPISFTCRLADTVNTKLLNDWLSGVTKIISGTSITQLYSRKGKTAISGITLPNFSDSTRKYAYQTEILWDGTIDLGYRYAEVHFPPGNQKITESADGVKLSVDGQIYGDVSRISAFATGYTAIV